MPIEVTHLKCRREEDLSAPMSESMPHSREMSMQQTFLMHEYFFDTVQQHIIAIAAQ